MKRGGDMRASPAGLPTPYLWGFLLLIFTVLLIILTLNSEWIRRLSDRVQRRQMPGPSETVKVFYSLWFRIISTYPGRRCHHPAWMWLFGDKALSVRPRNSTQLENCLSPDGCIFFHVVCYYEWHWDVMCKAKITLKIKSWRLSWLVGESEYITKSTFVPYGISSQIG